MQRIRAGRGAKAPLARPERLLVLAGVGRLGGDGRRFGVRVHHDRDVGELDDRHRAGRYDDRAGPAVRHVDRAGVHDAGDRGFAGPLVLVASSGAAASGSRLVAPAGKCRQKSAISVKRRHATVYPGFSDFSAVSLMVNTRTAAKYCQVQLTLRKGAAVGSGPGKAERPTAVVEPQTDNRKWFWGTPDRRHRRQAHPLDS